ncbi:protein kinase domain-containing protein [Actinoallomurus sp. CA-142502]|uniref:serine/threonine-protein kinase n=1 Tax=Actinoallomurus sp. CA-142502 TaxID=3239885 RepID=UPI003D8F9CA2
MPMSRRRRDADERTVAGRYRLEAKLGAGGMGEVWRARDERLGRTVALKLIKGGDGPDSPAGLARFEREAKVTAMLSGHPHIVTLYDFGRDPIFVVMEMLTGRTLADVLREGRPEIGRVLRWCRQVSEALAAAHSAGIVHRDIKPANLHAGPDDTVKVLDFGIAALTADAGDHTRMTTTGVVIGSCPYMAPEQIRAEPVDGRTDLYALGCVLYELVVGEPPFGTGPIYSVLEGHVNGEAIAPRLRRPDVPVGLDRLILALLAKRPADRPADAATVRDWLDDLIAGKRGGPAAASRLASLDDVLTELARADGRDDPAAAVAAYADAVPDLERMLGEDHPQALDARRRQAGWTAAAGDPERARDLYARLVPDIEAVVGPDDRGALIARRDLAEQTGQAGDARTAARLYEELLPALERVLGADDPVTLNGRARRADWVGHAGDPVAAIRLFDEVIPQMRRVLGTDHVEVRKAFDAKEVWRPAGQAADDRRLERLEHRLGDAGLVQRSGERERAAELFRALISDLLDEVGPDHALTAHARLGLADCLRELDDWPGAVRLAGEQAESYARFLGPDDPRTLDMRLMHAGWTDRMGDPVAAVELYRPLVADLERVLGPGDRRTLIARRDLADCVGKAGDAAEAVELLGDVVADLNGALGPGDGVTVRARERLAWFTADTGEKARLYEDLLPALRRVVGEDDEVTLRARQALAGCRERPAEKAEALRPVVADMRRALGARHGTTLNARAALAFATGQDDPAEGARLYRELIPDLAEADARATHGGMDVLLASINLSSTTARTGDAAEAVQILGQIMPNVEEAFGADHFLTVNARRSLAELRHRLADPAPTSALNDRFRAILADDADPARTAAALAELVADFEAAVGRDHPDTLRCRERLAAMTARAGDPAAGAEMYLALLPRFERCLGAEHAEAVAARTNGAHVMDDAGRYAEALDTFRRTVPDLERIFGVDDRRVLDARWAVACLLVRTGDQDGADRELAQALPVIERVFGPDAPETRRARELRARSAAPREEVRSTAAGDTKFRFTDAARRALEGAVRHATAEGHPEVTAVHLLLELLGDPAIGTDLVTVGADPDAIRADAMAAIARLPRATGSSMGRPAADRALVRAAREAGEHARQRGQEFTWAIDLLTALSAGSGDAAAALVKWGASSGTLRSVARRHGM